MPSANKFKIWVSTFRLRTLPLALASMLAGAFLSKLPESNCFDWQIFLFSCTTTIFLQILSNLANDYGDAMNGADTVDRVGPQRAVSSGLVTPKEMKIAIGVFISLSLFSGIYLLYISFKSINYPFLALLGLGLLSIFAAIKYTAGKNPYGYKGLGDIAVFVFFGPIAVMGSHFLYSKILSFEAIPISISFGLLATAVLNANNIRDIETDSATGKNTIAVKLGKNSAIIYQISIIFISLLTLMFFLFIYFPKSYILQVGITGTYGAIFFKNMKFKNTYNPVSQTNILKFTALSSFLIALILFLIS